MNIYAIDDENKPSPKPSPLGKGDHEVVDEVGRGTALAVDEVQNESQ